MFFIARFVTSSRALPAATTSESGNVVRIPILAHVSAGNGYENGEIGEEVGESFFSWDELRRLTNRDPGKLRALLVVGESMELVLRANDVVVYMPQQTIEDDGIYVLLIDEGAKVKRVQRYGGGAIEIIPENSVYSREMFVPLEDADTPNMYRSRESGLVTRLRKTYGTILASAGMPLRTIQKLLGHSDIRITARVYADVMGQAMKEHVDAAFADLDL